MSETWGDLARPYIHECYQKLKEAHSDWDDDRIMNYIRLRHYPWGEREYWPYKVWLKCIKEYRRRLSNPPMRVDDLSEDLPLFSRLHLTRQ